MATHTKKPTSARADLIVRKGDRVKVVAGKDKGLVGEIIAVDRSRAKVTVEGVNVVKRHRKESQSEGGRRTEGGIISAEAPIHASNVQLLVKDDAGAEVVTRVGYRRDEVTKRRSDGTEYQGTRSVRIARKTGKEV